MEAYSEKKETYHITLALDIAELRCLKAMLQNPLSEEESDIEYHVRMTIWDSIDLIEI